MCNEHLTRFLFCYPVCRCSWFPARAGRFYCSFWYKLLPCLLLEFFHSNPALACGWYIFQPVVYTLHAWILIRFGLTGNSSWRIRDEWDDSVLSHYARRILVTGLRTNSHRYVTRLVVSGDTSISLAHQRIFWRASFHLGLCRFIFIWSLSYSIHSRWWSYYCCFSQRWIHLGHSEHLL